MNISQETLQKLIKVYEAAKSALVTHEVQTENPPWAGNSIMEGCVRGFWMGTPKKLRDSIGNLEDDAEFQKISKVSTDDPFDGPLSCF